jgi:hypothetical protein
MPMFMVVGGLDPDFDFGPVDEGWIIYVEGRSARNAMETALEEVDFNPDAEQKQIFLVHPMTGRAREYRFLWEPKVAGRLTSI